MLVTAVEKGKGGYYYVFIEGEYYTALLPEDIIKNGIKAGLETTAEFLEEVRCECDLRKAKNKGIHLLGFKDRTKSELVRRLSENYDSDIAFEAVEQLEALGLINEESYADRLAKDYHNIKKFAKSRIYQELLQKGISKELAEEAILQFDDDEESIEEQMKAIIEKKYTRCISDEKGRRRAMNGLLRLGYSHRDIRKVLNGYEVDEDEFEDV